MKHEKTTQARKLHQILLLFEHPFEGDTLKDRAGLADSVAVVARELLTEEYGLADPYVTPEGMALLH